MTSDLWARAHGATTHFPIALALGSAAFDAAGLALARHPAGAGLRSAGRWTMLGAALGAVPAAASGLLMSRGVVMGHDLLRLHHLFIWPSFGLLVSLGTWRALAGDEPPRRVFARYLILAAAAAAAISAGAYFGGEMMLSGAP